MQNLLRWPLIAAAGLIVFRVVLEQVGSPESINNIFGVTWLSFLVPIYFALMLTAGSGDRPYGQLFKNLLLFAVLTRLMIWPTYSLAYLLEWQAPRFQLAQGGVVGEGVSALAGLLVIPFRNMLIGTAVTLVIGLILGCAVIALRRRRVVSGAV